MKLRAAAELARTISGASFRGSRYGLLTYHCSHQDDTIQLYDNNETNREHKSWLIKVINTASSAMQAVIYICREVKHKLIVTGQHTQEVN